MSFVFFQNIKSGLYFHRPLKHCALLHMYRCAPTDTVMLRYGYLASGSTQQLLTAGLLFDWLYPAHFPMICLCLEAWADTPEVTTALLRFMAEFVMNKNTRLAFDSSSPNGILLFREVSKVCQSSILSVLSLSPPHHAMQCSVITHFQAALIISKIHACIAWQTLSWWETLSWSKVC